MCTLLGTHNWGHRVRPSVAGDPFKCLGAQEQIYLTRAAARKETDGNYRSNN